MSERSTPCGGVPLGTAADEPALIASLSAISLELARATAATLDSAIHLALSRVAALASADGAFVYQFSADALTLSITHQHAAAGFETYFPVVERLSVQAFPEPIQAALEGRVIEAPDVEALSPEVAPVAAALRAFGLRGVLAVPLVDARTVLGGVGFSWVSRPGEYSPAMLSVLQTVGQLIAGALVRVRSQHDLAEAESRLRSYIATTAEGIGCFELEGEGLDTSLPIDEQYELMRDSVLVDCNEVYALMRGSKRADVVGLRLRDVSLESSDVVRDLFGQAASRGYSTDGLEFMQRTTAGDERSVVCNVRGVTEAGRLRRVWVVFRDVTAERLAEERQKSLEAQLRQVQKLDSIGLLAGGIAHDFNNLLLVTSSYARLGRLAQAEGRSADVVDALGRIEQAAERANELTQQLLTFGRQQPIAKRPVDLDDRVRSTLGLLRRLVPASVALDFRPGCGGVVDADPSQIDQILVNLVVNAADALVGGGQIVVATADVPATEVDPVAKSGRRALLSVADTGQGMTAAVRERIFEPFFTTKPADRGTGLGLSVVYGAVHQHGGEIRVDSRPGEGTTFRVYLPLASTGRERAAVDARPLPAGGSETVLLAEDHGMVRDLVTKILERAGYRVISAKDGAEAKHLFDRHAREVDLLIVDAVMPIASGEAVLDHVRTARPAIPVIISSGYMPGTFDKVLDDASTFVVPKPYDVDDLLSTVRSALDARAPCSTS